MKTIKISGMIYAMQNKVMLKLTTFISRLLNSTAQLVKAPIQIKNEKIKLYEDDLC